MTKPQSKLKLTRSPTMPEISNSALAYLKQAANELAVEQNFRATSALHVTIPVFSPEGSTNLYIIK